MIDPQAAEPVNEPVADPAQPSPADAPAAPSADSPLTTDPIANTTTDSPPTRQTLNAERQQHSAATANFYGGVNISAFWPVSDEPLYRPGERLESAWEGDVDAAEVQHIGFVFERPPAYGPALACLQEKRLVILHGPDGSGKSAATIHLARTIHISSQASMRVLSADANLLRWSSVGRLRRDTVYLIDGFLADRARQVADHVWRELAGSLRDANCWLVICASEFVTFGDGATPYRQQWAAPPDSALILRKHLQVADVDQGDIDRLLAAPEVTAVLNRRPSPRQIRLLAQRLVTHLDGGYDTPAEALRDFATGDETVIANWFKGAKNDEERARWLALAVFNGSRFQLALEASQKLAQRITVAFPPPKEQQRPPDDQPAPPPDLWFTPLIQKDDWRTRAGVELRHEAYYGANMPTAEVVRLKNPELPRVVLGYLWDRVPEFRPVLLEWLVELGLSSQSEARIRAGTAAAFLAEREYETVLHQVLERWVAVAATSREARQSLAYALGSLVTAGRYADASFILLQNWARSSNVGRVWAATRAYGIIGLAHPRQAMDGWLDILARYDYLKEVKIDPSLRVKVIDPDLARFFTSLLEAITSFFINALTQPRPEFVRVYGEIVSSLRVNLEERDDDGLFTLTILILFLGLMTLRIDADVAPLANETTPTVDKAAEAVDEATATVEPAIGGLGSLRGREAPALLVLVHNLEDDAPALDDLGKLLGRLIQQRETRHAAIHGALHDWLAYLQETGDEQLFVALCRVMKTLVRQKSFADRRWRREVGLALEHWTARRPGRVAAPPLPLAGRLLDEITELQKR